MPTPDPEGAREVTMIWKSHQPSPGSEARPDGKPNLDFKKMNKLAAQRCVRGNGIRNGREEAGLNHEDG